MLAYLSAHPGVRLPRDRLMNLLWGDRGQTQARDSLRQSLAEIRRSAGDLVHTDRDRLWLDPAQVGVDEPDAEHDAPLFDDLNHITPEFDEWLTAERHRRALDLWERIRCEVEAHLACGRGADALPLIDRMHSLDPYNEDWLRLAMQAEFHACHPAGIEKRFKEMAESLRTELGVAPAAETRALHDRLLAELSNAQASSGFVPAEPLPVVDSKARTGQPALRRLWAGVAASLAFAGALGLTQSAQTAAADPPRLAVLPFQAMGGVDPRLAEGIAGEVLSSLSQQRNLDTIGRTSSWMFKDKPEDLRRVGRKLDVDYVVEGSVRRASGALWATVALINTRDGSVLWSGRFLSRSGDVQRIEQAATAAIMQRLGLQLSGAARQADPRAYSNYVRAKALVRERKWPEMSDAHVLLVEAVKLDPTFAPAWAQLAGAITFLGTWKAEADWQKMALAAARRAVALDPNLPEAHQMLAFSHGLGTEQGRAHLRHALQLDPRNSQSLYWWGLTAERSGNFDVMEQAASAALARDPFWTRAAESVGTFAILSGRRSVAKGIVDRLRAADPDAAVEVEIGLAKAEGDLSRVIQIGRDRENFDVVNSGAAGSVIVDAMRELGYVREALLVDYAGPFERSVHLRQLGDRQTILKETQAFVGSDEEFWLLRPILFELSRTDRHEDLVALFDRQGSTLPGLLQIRPGNRMARHLVGAFLARSLMHVGRRSEAARLFRGLDEAQRVMLANERVPQQIYAELALNEAIRGRSDRAIAFLDRAVAQGWFAFDGLNYRLSELPWFASLGGDPRFERLRRLTEARLARERRETQALGLI